MGPGTQSDQMDSLLEELEHPPGSTQNSEDCNTKMLTFSLVLAVTGAALGSFPFGFNLGSINAPESMIREFIDDTQKRRAGEGFTENTLTLVWAFTAAIFASGGCLGAAGGGWWATRFGRRDGSLLASSLGIVAGLLMMVCRSARMFELIIIGRFIVGIQCGLFTALTPLYLAEISPVQARGAIGVVHQLALVTGMLTAQVLGFPVLLGTERSWHVLLGLTAVPSFAQAVVLPFCVESPRYLLTVKKDRAGCRQALQVLRGCPDVDSELDLLTSEKETDGQDKPLTTLELLLDTGLRQPLMLGVVLHLSQQLNGIPGVFFYSTRLFRDAGLSENAAKYTTSSLGVIMVTMGVLTVPLMDRLGRRTLLLVGLGGMTVMAVLTTFTLNFRNLVWGFEIVSIVFILVFVVFFALGPASVPWLIVPELFTHEARPAAVAICTFVNWSANFLVSFGFPLFQVYLRDFVFLPFAVGLLLFYLFAFFKLPETKGKTFREISVLLGVNGAAQKTAKVNQKQQDMMLKETRSLSDPKLEQQNAKADRSESTTTHYGSTDHLTQSDKIT